MNKFYFLVIISIGLLFISACDNSSTGISGPFKGGTDGLEISFVDSAPPSSFNQDESVPVRIKIKNNGENNIAAGEAKVKLFGVYLPSFTLDSNYLPSEGAIPGISEFIDDGGEQEIDMGELKYTRDIFNSNEFTLKAKACYPYMTKSQIETCVSSVSIEESGGDKVCSISGNKVTGGSVSSAPVQVTSLTEEFRGANQILFKVKVENKGDGEAYDLSKSCEDLENDVTRGSSKGIINVEVLPADFVCSFLDGESNTGTIRLGTDQGKEFTCRMNVEDADANYFQGVNVNLRYKYTTIGDTSFTIYEVIS